MCKTRFKILSIVLSFVLLFGTLFVPTSAIAPGDVNYDGKINSRDSLLLRQFVAGFDRHVAKSADLNNDGKINAADVLWLRLKIAKHDISAYTEEIDASFPKGWRRGVNMGNMLEAESEGAGGYRLEDEYLKVIAEAGFDFVRVPVRFSAYIDSSGNIDETFLQRMDHVLNACIDNHLGVIFNIHHFDALMEDPQTNKELFLKMWEQLASRYQHMPDSVVFELLNEPSRNLDVDQWNALQKECIALIRKTNPTRDLIVTGTNYSNAGNLPLIELPENDKHLIVTFHYYEPFNFTHQGASWTSGTSDLSGITWNNTKEERDQIDWTFQNIKAWSEETGIPVLLGEFGAYGLVADMESRVRWTTCVRETAEKYDFAWSYWEFCSGFGFYDTQTKTFNPIYNALVPQKGEN